MIQLLGNLKAIPLNYRRRVLETLATHCEGNELAFHFAILAYQERPTRLGADAIYVIFLRPGARLWPNLSKATREVDAIGLRLRHWAAHETGHGPKLSQANINLLKTQLFDDIWDKVDILALGGSLLTAGAKEIQRPGGNVYDVSTLEPGSFSPTGMKDALDFLKRNAVEIK